MPLSDNGKDVLNTLIAEFGKWLIVIAGVVTLWIQSHNQHDDRMAVGKEQVKKLDAIAVEVKATARPLVFGEK
jgi:hypothetical protein